MPVGSRVHGHGQQKLEGEVRTTDTADESGWDRL